jgi:hypothetical protein
VEAFKWAFNARAAARSARAHTHTSPQQQEQPPVDVPRRSKKKQVSLPGASILFQRPTIPFHLIEPHSRRALNAPVELPDNPQGMINPNHPNHYLWLEMCDQLHTPITGSSGLQE